MPAIRRGQDVVVSQRLFDHQQIEFVQLFQQLDIVQRVGGIGVYVQAMMRELFAHGFSHFVIASRFDFDLDALVAGGDFGFDFLEQLRVRFLQADGHAARDFGLRAAEQLPERNVLSPCF